MTLVKENGMVQFGQGVFSCSKQVALSAAEAVDSLDGIVTGPPAAAIVRTASMAWCRNTSPPFGYEFDEASAVAADGVNVVRPRDRTALQPGRWRLFSTGGTGGSLEPAQSIVVASVRRLVDIVTTNLTNGVEIEVGTVEDLFYLETNPSAVVLAATDQISIVQPAVGTTTHRWIRRNLGSLRWELQSAWVINATTGNDENGGGVGSPLATHDELERRLGPSPNLISLVTVQVETALPRPINIPRVRFDAGGYLVYHGTPTLLATATVTAVTPENQATQQRQEITAPAIVDWTPYLGKRLRRVSDGAWCWVDTRVAATIASVSQLGTVVLSPPTTGTPTLVTWAVNDVFVVEDLPTVPGIVGDAPFANRGTTNAFIRLAFEGLDVPREGSFCVQTGPFSSYLPLLAGCSLGVTGAGAQLPVGCSLNAVMTRIDGSINSTSVVLMRACFTRGLFVGYRGFYLWSFNSRASGNAGGAGLTVGRGAFVEFGNASFFGNTGAGLRMDPGAYAIAPALLWGAGNATFGADVSGELAYSVKPTVTGAALQDARQGGVVLPAWAGVPVPVDVNNGAGIFVAT